MLVTRNKGGVKILKIDFPRWCNTENRICFESAHIFAKIEKSFLVHVRAAWKGDAPKIISGKLIFQTFLF